MTTRKRPPADIIDSESSAPRPPATLKLAPWRELVANAALTFAIVMFALLLLVSWYGGQQP